jgi:hypothetical protein
MPLCSKWLAILRSTPDVIKYKVQWAREAGTNEEDIIVTGSWTDHNTLINIMAEPHRKLLVERGVISQEDAEGYRRAWEELEATKERGF